MRTAAAYGASPAGSGFRFKKDGVEIRKVFELQPRNFSSDETFDRLQGRNFFTIHERECVADVLSAASPADSMHIIFGVLGHIVIDNVTNAGDIESARGDVGRDHDFVFAALETFQRFDALALRPIGMQDCDGMVSLFQFVRDLVRPVLGSGKN